MIRNMVSKLQEQAVKEAEQHGWCEAKKAEVKIDLEDKQSTQEQLTAENEKLTAKISGLDTEIKDLKDRIAFLSQDRSAATETRNANKAENDRIVAESKEGQTAVSQAVSVLREFYSGAAKETEGTETYGGQQERGAGVL